MSKTKAKKPRNMSDLPPRPPQDLNEAVLFGASSKITPQVQADYVSYVYQRNCKSKKAQQAGVRAVMMFATVGFAFVNWQNNRTE